MYIYVDVIILPNGKPKFKNRKVEEIKYYRVKDNQLMEKFIRQLEGRVGGSVGGGTVRCWGCWSMTPRSGVLLKKHYKKLLKEMCVVGLKPVNQYGWH